MYTKFIKNRFSHTHLKNNHATTVSNYNSKNKSHKGFTLIEIIVSVMLIAIFLVIFGPPLVDMFKEIVNSSDNEASFNNAYNQATLFATTGTTDIDPFLFDSFASTNVTITLNVDGETDETKQFTIPRVISYFVPYDTGSFGNARELCFNDYFVDPRIIP